jgi:hypothetical protein
MSLQLKIYLERAGLLTENKKTEEEKLEDFLKYLHQYELDHEEDEHPDDVEDDEDDEDEDSEKKERHHKKLKEDTESKPTKEKVVKEKKYSSNDKGVLHELLVGKHLLGKHMTLHKDKVGDSPKAAHDKIKEALFKKHGNHDEYNRLNTKAKSAANDIRKHAEKNGHKIHDVHWTSKPGDIKKSTGIEASQKDDASDIMIHTHHEKTKKKKYIGASLKVTDGKSKHITASNPGMEATHGAHHIVDIHRTKLLKAHPQLIGVKSPEKRKEMMNADPKMKADVVSRNHKATVDIAKHLHKHLSTASKEDLVHHIKTHVLQANKTPLQHNGHEHIRHTTYQSSNKTGNKTLHDTINPSEHWNDKLSDHKNITVHHDGKSGTIHFKHNGKTFASHRIRVASSSDPMTSFKGDGKAHE